MEKPLDDIFGDRRALPGTESWAKSWRLQLAGAFKTTDSDVGFIQSMLVLGQKFEAWKLLHDAHGKPFATLWAFCEAPEPHGCGVPAAKVRGLLEAAHGKAAVAAMATRPEAAPTHADAGKKGGRPKKDAEPPKAGERDDGLSRKRGTDPNYLSARIARDAPEVHEAMKAGKYKSVRAAAIAAGIVKPPDPVKRAASAMAKVPSPSRVDALWSAVERLPRHDQELLCDRLVRHLEGTSRRASGS